MPRNLFCIPPWNYLPSDHSNLVAQRHATVSCSVSSSLARIADAEWARCCESVRKSSPQIGSLGQWHSLCDGGWMGEIPGDLPDIDTPVVTGPPLAALPAVEEELNSGPDPAFKRTSLAITSRDHTNTNPPLSLPSQTTDSDLSQHDPVTVKSDIPALDHFPAPPVHFPLPHPQRGLTGSPDGTVGNPPSYGRQMTFPVLRTQESPDFAATIPTELAVVTVTQTPSPATNKRVEISTHLSAPSLSDQYQTLSLTDPTGLTAGSTDFGIRQPHTLPSGPPGSSNLPKGSPRNSSVVLAMRNRFAQNVSYDRCSVPFRG